MPDMAKADREGTTRSPDRAPPPAGPPRSSVGERLWWRLQGARNRTRWLGDPFRSVRDLGWRARAEFRRHRSSPEYQAAFDQPEPLVSICIGTYNRARLLRDRALRSSLAQTWSNIEIIVVGDCCTDETAELMAQVDDPRVRFVNLAKRGDYPEEPYLRWMVAGT